MSYIKESTQNDGVQTINDDVHYGETSTDFDLNFISSLIIDRNFACHVSVA